MRNAAQKYQRKPTFQRVNPLSRRLISDIPPMIHETTNALMLGLKMVRNHTSDQRCTGWDGLSKMELKPTPNMIKYERTKKATSR
jgi:hypothetical protein